jgi:predicted DNA-binding helix-hairpin-helix protein
VNVELPTEVDLKRLAPEKSRGEIETSMNEIHDRIDEHRTDRAAGFKVKPFAPAGQSTQMIVGATETPDAAVLGTASKLYSTHRLRRVYYSAFSPIPDADTRLPPQSPPLVREHRLYQADWLLRFYGFDVGELFTPATPNLDLAIDPKLAWALEHREHFPVDVNRGSREMLLRIPGIGARTVSRMLRTRRHTRLRVKDLQRLRVAWNRAQYFVIAADHAPRVADLQGDMLRQRIIRSDNRQLTLFDR